jgi:hypothetical protein
VGSIGDGAGGVSLTLMPIDQIKAVWRRVKGRVLIVREGGLIGTRPTWRATGESSCTSHMLYSRAHRVRIIVSCLSRFATSGLRSSTVRVEARPSGSPDSKQTHLDPEGGCDRPGSVKKIRTPGLDAVFAVPNFFAVERREGSAYVRGRPRFRAPLRSNLLVPRRWK